VPVELDSSDPVDSCAVFSMILKWCETALEYRLTDVNMREKNLSARLMDLEEGERVPPKFLTDLDDDFDESIHERCLAEPVAQEEV